MFIFMESYLKTSEVDTKRIQMELGILFLIEKLLNQKKKENIARECS